MARATRSYYIPDELHAFAAATGNASTYIAHLLEERRAAYAEARATLQMEGYTHPMILCVADVQNGHLYTEGLKPSVEITMNLEDAPEYLEKWGITEAQAAQMLSMTDRTAQALRLVVEEFWQGRKLD